MDQDYIDKATEQTINIEQTINLEIRSSRFVVADITGNHPNVLHEIGQAYSLDKPIVIISQNPRSSAPFNIRGFPIIRYDRNYLKELRKKLGAAFLKATSDNEILRAMLAPPSLGPPLKRHSSLGTEAACRAFTDVACIKEIRKRLAAINVELENHRQPFWCLISLKKSMGTETEEVIPETLRVHEVAPLQRP